VFLSDRDFHPTVGTYSQAHSSTAFRALAPAASFPWLVGKESIALALMRHFGSLAALSRASFRNCGNSFHSRKRRLLLSAFSIFAIANTVSRVKSRFEQSRAHLERRFFTSQARYVLALNRPVDGPKQSGCP